MFKNSIFNSMIGCKEYNMSSRGVEDFSIQLKRL